MGLKFNNRTILIKDEVTQNTDSVPTGALNAILTKSISFTPFEPDSEEREIVRPFFGNYETIIGAVYGMFEIEVELQGRGVGQLGVAPAWSALLRSSGHAETIVAVTSVSYAPVSDLEKSLTAYYFMGGNVYKLLGAKGSPMFSFNSKKRPIAKFKFTGLSVPVAVAALPAVVLTAFQPPIAVNKANSVMAIHGFAAAMESFDFDGGVDNQYINRVNVEQVQMVGRKGTGKLKIEEPLQSAIDFFDRAKNVTLGAFSLTHGITPGLRVKFNAASCQVVKPTQSDMQNIAMLDLDLKFMPSTVGNDDYALLFD